MNTIVRIASTVPMVLLSAAACSAPPHQEQGVDSKEALSSTSPAAAEDSQRARGPLLVTATNAAANALLVYDVSGTLLQTVPTTGAGGVGGNAGGVSADGSVVAAVNFGSRSVSLFVRERGRLNLIQVLPTASPPVSVALDDDHLYVLGTTTVESHRRGWRRADERADGVAPLVQANGSAAHVGILGGEQLLITEKGGTVELVGLRRGAVGGSATAVAIAPKDSDTPLGLVTHGRTGYVTLAHSDEVGLIRDGSLLALAATGSDFPSGPGQQAPCWIAHSGWFLFTSNTPSHSISRLVATPRTLAVDAPIAASTAGAPTDIAAAGRLLAVLEGNGNGVSHLTQYTIGDDGSLAVRVSTEIANAANGLAIVEDD